MFKSFFKIKYLSVLCMLSLLSVSCNNDDETLGGTNQITQADVKRSLEVEEISNFIDGITLENISQTKSQPFNLSKNNDCTSFTIANSGYTISFNDCDFDGNTVNGSMTVTVSFDNNVFTSSVVFDNLTYGGNQINGLKTSSYSLNSNGGVFTYSITSDIAVVLEDGSSASENGTKNYEVTGLGTSNVAYSISGNWDVTINADSYSLSANPALTGSFDCVFITAGVLTITENGSSASVDFGDGACDSTATVTLPDGTVTEIEL